MASPEVIDSSGTMGSSFHDELSAPDGWKKKLLPKKAGTPKRKDVVYVAPDGEEIKSKRQLEKYLKSHPGGASLGDFDWSTGETPRRSARLSTKGRLSSDSTEAEPVTKRSKRNSEDSKEVRSPSSSTRGGKSSNRKSQPPAANAGKEEVMEEADEVEDVVAAAAAAAVGTISSSDATATIKPLDAEKKADGEDKLDEDKATPTGDEIEEDAMAHVVEGEEATVTIAESESAEASKPLAPEEELASVGDKVIAEEQVSTTADSTLDVVTSDTIMEETTLIVEEKVETTMVENVAPDVEEPLKFVEADVAEVIKPVEGETSLKEDTLVIKDTIDVPMKQSLEGKEVDTSLVINATKDDSLKPKDHIEPQGIRALIEEPVLCGVAKSEQTTEPSLPAAEQEQRQWGNLKSYASEMIEKQSNHVHISSRGNGSVVCRVTQEAWNATDSSHILAVKTALHLSAVPDLILCRESEQRNVINFCKSCIMKHQAGSIYICGCPGTGKSLTIERVKLLCNDWSSKFGRLHPEIVTINCTSLTDPRQIYLKVLQAIKPRDCNESHISSASIMEELKRLLCVSTESKAKSAKGMMFLIVDEMDYLITRDQSVLYDLFRLPTLPNSRCILIGIANAIDLTNRLLPKLRSMSCKVDVVTFPAYTKDQILEVLNQRLQGLPYLVFQQAALELCARKVAAATGDMRKALHVCRSAIEILESEVYEEDDEVKDGSSAKLDKCDGPNLDARQKKAPVRRPGLVEVDTMARALSRSFRSPFVETIQALPKHQQMVLCATVRHFRHGKKDATLGQLNTSYLEFCKSTRMQALVAPEFSSVCQVLADQALLSLGTNREDRLRRVTLKVDQEDVIFALQGVRFFRNCLS